MTYRYDDGVTTVLRLPDEVAALLEKRASERGLTLTELVSEMARRPRDRRALEAFIGCADTAVDEPFDIHQARADAADELLRDFDDRGASRAKRSSRSDGRSLDFG